MRSVCGPKHKLSEEIMDGVKNGQFIDDNKDLKCYTLCIAQMAGTVSILKSSLLYQSGSYQFGWSWVRIPQDIISAFPLFVFFSRPTNETSWTTRKQQPK